MPTLPPEKAKECLKDARDLFGTAYIFEKRARRTRFFLRVLTFTGVAGPALLGALGSAYGLQWSYLPMVVGITAVVAVVQLIVSLWSLVSQWDSDLAYSLESYASNYRLSEAYFRLATTEESKAKVDQSHARFEGEARLRTEMDMRQGITDKEKRLGMRAALRHFQWECPGCKKTPLDMNSSKCPVCGLIRFFNL